MQTLLDKIKFKLFTIFKVPLIHYTRPQVIKNQNDKTIIKIPFLKRNKNHVNSVYFGALSIGADMCVGLQAMYHINKTAEKVILVFKDFKADFKKRAMSDVHLICEEGALCEQAVEKAIQSKERVNQPIKGYAICPKISDDVVMEFELTLSLKVKS